MTHKQQAFQAAAEGIIRNLERRNMEGYFYENSKSCTDAVLGMIPDGSVISWGGTETLKETGMLNALQQSGLLLIDRSQAKSPEEARSIFAKAILSDYYFMSSNAITLDGELVNIDGNGNRLACLIHGPRHVFILVGMNKIVSNVENGVARVRNFAAPPNAKRLDRRTPCNTTGRCGDCLSPDCMCSQIVITRHSGQTGRIKVFLIAEDLGY